MSTVRSKGPRGATGVRIGLRQRALRWLDHHRQEALIALNRLIAEPVASLLTLLLLAVALALPGFALTLIDNIKQLAPGSEIQPQLSLYLQPDLPETQVDRFSRELLLRDDLLSVELISPEKGAREFREVSELGDILELFDANPLPAVILLMPANSGAEELERIKQDLIERPEVDLIEVDLEWIERLGALIRAFERVSFILALFLAMTVLLVVANSIRMTINTRLEEIEVSLLIGASPAWVRRPFLYAGFWYGLFGALIAIVLIFLALALVEQPLRELTTLYIGQFELAGPGAGLWAGLLGGGAVLGWAGAYIAVSRQLSQLNAREVFDTGH